MRFQELFSSITELERELGNYNLIGLSLELVWSSADTLPENRLLELVGTFRSLNVLTIDFGSVFSAEKWIVVPLL